jgi:hypothetical protein
MVMPWSREMKDVRLLVDCALLGVVLAVIFVVTVRPLLS